MGSYENIVIGVLHMFCAKVKVWDNVLSHVPCSFSRSAAYRFGGGGLLKGNDLGHF